MFLLYFCWSVWFSSALVNLRPYMKQTISPCAFQLLGLAFHIFAGQFSPFSPPSSCKRMRISLARTQRCVCLFVCYFGDKVSLLVKLASNSCQSPCFSPTSAGIPTVCHHTWILLFFFLKSHAHAYSLNYYLIPSEHNSLK